MTDHEQYTPGPASGAQPRKDGRSGRRFSSENCATRRKKSGRALTDAAHLREWAPFEADGSLGMVGTTVKVTTVGAPTPQVSKTTVTRAKAPKVLVRRPGYPVGTRTLWRRSAPDAVNNIDRRFIKRAAG